MYVLLSLVNFEVGTVCKITWTHSLFLARPLPPEIHASKTEDHTPFCGYLVNSLLDFVDSIALPSRNF